MFSSFCRCLEDKVPPFLYLHEKLINSKSDEERYKNYRYRRTESSSLRKRSFTGNGRFSGYVMDLLDRISNVVRGIDFEYEVELVPDGKYGGRPRYSKIWNGMIGEVVRGKADVAAGPLTITDGRKAGVDFTIPFMAAGIQALTLNTDYVHHDPFRIIYPFTIEVWFLNGFIFFLTALMIWAFNRLDPYEWRKVAKENDVLEGHKDDFSFKNSLWFCASTLFLQGYHSSPRSNASRCIVSFWYLFLLAMFFLYIVNFKFFVTSQTLVNTVKTPDDLKDEKRILYGIVKGSDTSTVFRSSKSLKSMLHKMNNDPMNLYVADLKEGVERVRNSNGFYTLLGQAPILRYIASQKPCDVDVAGGYLLRTQYAFAVAKGSPLKEHLSAAIEALHGSGVLSDLERDWWDLDDRTNRCRNQTAFERSGAYSLFINDVSGVYYMLTIGILTSASIFVVEYVYYYSRGGNNKQFSLAGSLKRPQKTTNGRFKGARNGTGHQYAQANPQNGADYPNVNGNMWI